MSKKIYNRENLINARFGKMTIIDLVPLKGTKGEHNQDLIAICKCDCGNIFEKSLTYILYKRNLSFKCEKCANEEINDNLKLAHEARRIYPKDATCQCCKNRPIYAKGLCRSCYSRYLRNGKVAPTQSVEERLEETKQKKLKAIKEREERGGLTPKRIEYIKKVDLARKELQLTEEQEKVANMFVDEKKSISEIAKEINISKQCVSDRLCRLVLKYENKDIKAQKKEEKLELLNKKRAEVNARKEARKRKFYEIEICSCPEKKNRKSKFPMLQKVEDISKLTEIEKIIFDLLGNYNYTIKEVCEAFNTTNYVIKFHINNMLKKVEVYNED